MATTLRELGEKKIIKEYILPLVNPSCNPMLAGDDCGVVNVPDGHYLCASTDRIPWDLTGYRLGIMSEYDLGYYLAVLNISDIAAMGAKPVGLLLNFGLPADFKIEHLQDLLAGVLNASIKYNAPILGGDLSDSVEPSLSATSLGIEMQGTYLRRTGAEVGDSVFTTGICGITATAFHYFLDAAPKGMRLSREYEELLRYQFTNPKAQVAVANSIARSRHRATAMDNTDGLGQSLHELAEASSRQYVLDESLFPLHPVSVEVAAYLNKDPIDMITGPGADFNLVGTINDMEAWLGEKLYKIGEVRQGSGVIVQYRDGTNRSLSPEGWNYYTS